MPGPLDGGISLGSELDIARASRAAGSGKCLDLAGWHRRGCVCVCAVLSLQASVEQRHGGDGDEQRPLPRTRTRRASARWVRTKRWMDMERGILGWASPHQPLENLDSVPVPTNRPACALLSAPSCPGPFYTPARPRMQAHFPVAMPDAHSPTSKTGSDDNVPLDAAERKKKNADAQAAFRARRANYIATLEETGTLSPRPLMPVQTPNIALAHTVTNLEAVVLQLQDSNRQLKEEVTDLRTQNVQLRNEGRDREKFWRALWQARSTGMPPDPLDDSSLPSYAQMHHSSPMHTPNRLASVSPTHYQDPRMQYAPDGSAPLAPQYHPNTATEYMQRSPALGFAPTNTVAGPSRAPSVDPHRINGYGAYPPYANEGSSPEDSWPQHGIPTPVTDRSNIDHSPSPTYVESPSMTSAELAYPSHPVVGDDQKVGPNGAPYNMYTTSRSTSPSSTPTSTSSLSLAAAPYQFTFPEGTAIQDRPEFNQRRPNYMNMRGPELTLHGGTADIPIAGTVGDAMRFRMSVQRANTLPGVLPPAYAPNGTHQESDEDDATSHQGQPQAGARSRSRRSTAPGAPATNRSSQSPSPPPPISGTLAVIKAQAFGAYRRSRPRTRRASGDAAKLSVEALSARGIAVSGGGPASKRQKLQNGASHDTMPSPP